jgi:hypothetical protein
MPGLLDLPPELIEQIFALTEDYVHAAQVQAEQPWLEELTRSRTKHKAPSSRLVNRYIESSARRLFTDRFFDTWRIQTADDQDIQKFCHLMESSDLLVKGLRELEICVDDDRVICIRQEYLQSNEGFLLDKTATHLLDEDTGAMVPSAYFRNRKNVIRAFRACSNPIRLYFYRSPGLEKLQREPDDDDDPIVHEQRYGAQHLGNEGEESTADNSSIAPQHGAGDNETSIDFGPGLMGNHIGGHTSSAPSMSAHQ